MAPLCEDRSHETLSTIELLLLGALSRAALIIEQTDYNDFNTGGGLVIDGEEIHAPTSSLLHHRGSGIRLRFGDAYNVLRTWIKNKDEHNISGGITSSSSSSSSSAAAIIGAGGGGRSVVGTSAAVVESSSSNTSAILPSSSSSSSRNVFPSNVRWQIEEGTALRALESLIQFDLVRIITSSSSSSLSMNDSSSSSSFRPTQGGSSSSAGTGQYWKGQSSTVDHRSSSGGGGGGGGNSLLTSFPMQTLIEAEVNRETLRWSPLSLNRDACHDVLSKAKDNATLPTELRRFLSQASSAAAAATTSTS